MPSLALACRLSAVSRASRRPFSPASLFSSGEQGVWYDPSDYSTLFQDAAGTIPVTAVEQPVGLMLDKSKGLVLGSELVTNGDFSNGTTGWTIGSGWAISSGVANANNAGNMFQYGTIVSGKWYRVSVDVTSYSAGPLYVGTISNLKALPTGTGTKVVYFLSDATSFYLAGINSFTGSIDNISVRELPGNHAYQTTATSRPVLSARYNLLTKTAQLNDAAWSQTNVTTPAADTILETVTSGTHRLQQTISVGATKYRFYAEFYPAGRNSAALQLYDITAGITKAHAVFSLTGNGSVLSNLQGSSGVTPLPDGWYSCYVESTVDFTAGNLFAWVAVTDGTTQSYAGDVTKGVKARNTDLRPTNAGVNLPPYQRVTTSTDYDTAGFPAYLKFDGIDDSLATGNIDFTGTDKMFVAAGVRTLAAGMIAELGINDGVSGSFGNYANTTFYDGRLSSGATRKIYGFDHAALPVTNVTSFSFDRGSSPYISGKVDGVSTAKTVVLDEAISGNFANQPIYIGRRGGTTLPYNGRIYSLVVCGKLASAAEITATEAWVNQKTRAF